MKIYYWILFLLLKLISLIALPLITIEKNAITTGGISSGCFMSTQLNYAYSSIISGNACTAGGPYWCAQFNEQIALTKCMDPVYSQFIDVNFLESVVYELELIGLIDPVFNLNKSKIWLLSTYNDTVVARHVVESNAQLYGKFINHNQIKLVTNMPGEHSQLTDSYGNFCEFLGSPYINNCAYNAAFQGLSWIYQPEKLLKSSTWFESNLFEFDQVKFIPLTYKKTFGIEKFGYIYVPSNCILQNGFSCKLHVVFHGCKQTIDTIGLEFIQKSGYLEIGEANNIVILFPQAMKNQLNPNGCWDWWGYTGPDYANKLSIQMQMVVNIIKSFNLV